MRTTNETMVAARQARMATAASKGLRAWQGFEAADTYEDEIEAWRAATGEDVEAVIVEAHAQVVAVEQQAQAIGLDARLDSFKGLRDGRLVFWFWSLSPATLAALVHLCERAGLEARRVRPAYVDVSVEAWAMAEAAAERAARRIAMAVVDRTGAANRSRGVILAA